MRHRLFVLLTIIVFVISGSWSKGFVAWAEQAADDQVDEVFLDEAANEPDEAAETAPTETTEAAPEAEAAPAAEAAPEAEVAPAAEAAPEAEVTPAAEAAPVDEADSELETLPDAETEIASDSESKSEETGKKEKSTTLDASEEEFLEEEAGIAPEERSTVKGPETKTDEYEVLSPEGTDLPVTGDDETSGMMGKSELPEIETAMAEAEKIPSILTTLEECKRVALLNDRRVQVALKQMQYEQFKIKEAERAFLPQAKGTYERQEGAAADQKSGAQSGGGQDTAFNSLKYGVEGEQILFQGGKLVYTLKQSKNNLDVARKKYYQARQEIIQKVEKAYYTLVKSQMIFEVQTDLSKAAESALAFSREAYRQGLNSFHEFLNVQSQTDQTYYQLMSYQQDITLAELALRQACNINASIGIQIDAVLTFADFNFNYSLDECLELAFKNRPDLAVNQLTTLSDYYGIKIAMAENWPKIVFDGSVGKNGQNQQGQKFELSDEWMIKLDATWMIGANTAKYAQEKKKTVPKTIGAQDNTKSSLTHTASLAIFDKLENFSNVAKAKVQQATSEADLVELRGKVANEVEENYFNYQKAMTMVTASLSKIKFREKDLEVNRAKQMMDEVPLSQVLTAELQLGEERVNYVKALADYYIAISGLFKAMGLAK